MITKILCILPYYILYITIKDNSFIIMGYIIAITNFFSIPLLIKLPAKYYPLIMQPLNTIRTFGRYPEYTLAIFIAYISPILALFLFTSSIAFDLIFKTIHKRWNLYLAANEIAREQ